MKKQSKEELESMTVLMRTLSHEIKSDYFGEVAFEGKDKMRHLSI